ncbi:hypothetical protein, partial [Pseudomonas syringae group genomosp. 7]|uniref:hypothetical protein n=1 Tax=Pseudomonas syringae group genomosp. 7 TaxID=251699 RepID=UPI00376F5661
IRGWSFGLQVTRVSVSFCLGSWALGSLLRWSSMSLGGIGWAGAGCGCVGGRVRCWLFFFVCWLVCLGGCFFCCGFFWGWFWFVCVVVWCFLLFFGLCWLLFCCSLCFLWLWCGVVGVGVFGCVLVGVWFVGVCLCWGVGGWVGVVGFLWCWVFLLCGVWWVWCGFVGCCGFVWLCLLVGASCGNMLCRGCWEGVG